MKQGIQDTLKNKQIKEYGCYFLSVIEMALRDSKDGLREEFLEEDIDKLYKKALSEKWIKEDCFMLAPYALYNEVFGLKVKSSVIMDLPVSKKDKYKTFIRCNTKKDKSDNVITHFTLQYGDEHWDPLPPARQAAQSYTLTGIRVLI